MTLIDEPLPGIKILKPFAIEDTRGNFVKPFHEGQLRKHGIQMDIREEFFSTSHKSVLRGMHFQVPPHAHQKIIYCITGSVLDVLLDLRVESPTFGKFTSFELSEQNRHVVYVPVGFAHGFLSLRDHSCLVYKTDAVHSPESDLGIHWNSFGFSWPAQDTMISERDQQHPAFRDFLSPF